MKCKAGDCLVLTINSRVIQEKELVTQLAQRRFEVANRSIEHRSTGSVKHLNYCPMCGTSIKLDWDKINDLVFRSSRYTPKVKFAVVPA